MESIKDFVIQLLYLAVFAAVTEIILPSGKTKKYITIVIGTIILISLLSPVTRFLKGGVPVVDLTREATAIETKSIESLAKKADQNMENSIISLYKKRIEDKVKEIVKARGKAQCKKVEVILDENLESPDYCKIIEIKLQMLWNRERENDIMGMRKMLADELGLVIEKISMESYKS